MDTVPEGVATTWVTACELFYGASRSNNPPRNRDLIWDFLDTIEVVNLDHVSAQLFGELKALLARNRLIIPDADLLIASIAAAHRAVLVTGNVRHFERIPGIGIEDWIRR